MKIIIDDKIPYIRETMAKIDADIVYKKGADINAEDVRDADALIVRTRTRCDANLLRDCSVRFIATATIGFDHIDTEYLKEVGITWVNCPGCNAASVAQYIQGVLLIIQQTYYLNLKDTTLGIVGCGHVGSKVRDVAQKMGMKVLINDPLIDNPQFVTLSEIEKQADIITFHVPMVKGGMYPTHHLADSNFFARLERKPIIINTSRGAVVDNKSLKEALAKNMIRQAVIDTWENEPNIDADLLKEVMIGTPHIAGYSADGKVNADNMVIKALCDFFNISNPGLIEPPALPSDFVFNGNPLQLYNPQEDSKKLKANILKFEELRGNYPLRREKYDVKGIK